MNSSNDLDQFAELESFDLLLPNLDTIHSFSNLFDLYKLDYQQEINIFPNQLDSVDGSLSDSNEPVSYFFLNDTNNSPNLTNDFINQYLTPSPLDNSPSTSTLSSSNSLFSFDTSLIEKIDFSKTDSGPITIIMPETENNGMKITSEITFNFDQPQDNHLLDQYDILEFDEAEKINVLSTSSNDTCIDLDESSELDIESEKPTLTEEEKVFILKKAINCPHICLLQRYFKNKVSSLLKSLYLILF